MAVVQGGLIRPAIRLLGERGTIIYGMVFEIISFAILAFLTNGLIALLLIPITAIGAVITPALQAMIELQTADGDWRISS